MTRASTDVDDMSQAVRRGLPELLVAGVTGVLAVAALVVNRTGPGSRRGSGDPPLVIATRCTCDARGPRISSRPRRRQW